MKKAIGISAAELIVLLAIGGPALAEPAENQRFFVTGRIEEPSITVVASGTITGVGSLAAESVDYRPTDKTYRETDLAVIAGGRLTISINGRFDVWPFTLDPRSCTQRGKMAGTWTIKDGGGDFAGATGDGTFSGHFFTFARRGHAGCDEAALKGFVAGPMVGTLDLRRQQAWLGDDLAVLAQP
ncbi:MAG: hypothetical protein JWR24_615 [Actinoallomurus sp.]|nr:hypothetical protein [Actinoallomurus sp.]